ncbi:F-box/kelch-repeat protein At1g30090 isoform X2 [Dioscorea cayenensis subsp. rotundata]|nr:F-box/kelch-repeat protein At1g30090 isoform X2 [Dioscorea cayenensis subsp. rotundata]
MQHVRISSYQSPVHKLGDSQMTLSPKFRLTATPATSSSGLFSSSLPLEIEMEPSLGLQPFIPGLPDDLALNCLLRLPVSTHQKFRVVCRRWHDLLRTKDRFFTERKLVGICSAWMFVFAFNRFTRKIQWHVLDLTHFSWHTIPIMPGCKHAGPNGFGCIAIPQDGILIVCGSMMSDLGCPLHVVLKYEMQKNRWTVMRQMLVPRSFFASGVIDGKVYVAGGYSTDQFELNSAEVLNPADGKWQQITSMGMNMAMYDSAALDERLFVTEGWAWPFLFSPRGQVYDPKTNAWESMTVGMREGWTGLSVVLDGHLFVISEHEDMRVKVYDMKTDSWDIVEGSPLPKRMISKPLSVSSYGSRLFVVGQGLHVAVGHIEKKSCCVLDDRKNWSFSIQWQQIETPSEFSDLTPSSSQILFA